MVAVMKKVVEAKDWAVDVICDWKSTWLPLMILSTTFAVASMGTWWTFLSLGMLPIVLRIARKQFVILDSSSFYLNFTIYSMLWSYYVFETVTHAKFASITRMEYLLAEALGGGCIFCIFLTRHLCNMAARMVPQVRRGQVIVENGVKYTSYDFCKKCRKVIAGRDHHCVWLNTCVGRVNKLAFVSTVAFGVFWLIITLMMNLTSICYPVYLFNGMGFNDGTGSSSSRWFLIPTNCPDVYGKGQFMVTMGYVTSIYGMGVAAILCCVLLHQVRLVIMGVSYLEYRYGLKKKVNGDGVNINGGGSGNNANGGDELLFGSTGTESEPERRFRFYRR